MNAIAHANAVLCIGAGLLIYAFMSVVKLRIIAKIGLFTILAGACLTAVGFVDRVSAFSSMAKNAEISDAQPGATVPARVDYPAAAAIVTSNWSSVAGILWFLIAIAALILAWKFHCRFPHPKCPRSEGAVSIRGRTFVAERGR